MSVGAGSRSIMIQIDSYEFVCVRVIYMVPSFTLLDLRILISELSSSSDLEDSGDSFTSHSPIDA